MYDRLRVAIDLTLLATFFSREDGRAVSDLESISRLHRAGFVRLGDLWVVKQADLGQLEPFEVPDVHPFMCHS